MFEALEREDEWDEDTDLSMGASGLVSLIERMIRPLLSCI